MSAFFAKVQNSLGVLYVVWVANLAVVIDFEHNVFNDIQTLISGILELIENKKRTLCWCYCYCKLKTKQVGFAFNFVKTNFNDDCLQPATWMLLLNRVPLTLKPCTLLLALGYIPTAQRLMSRMS